MPSKKVRKLNKCSRKLSLRKDDRHDFKVLEVPKGTIDPDQDEGAVDYADLNMHAWCLRGSTASLQVSLPLSSSNVVEDEDVLMTYTG